MPLQRTETPVLTVLPENLPKIFEQAQISTANHQKNFVALNKLHSAAASVTAALQNGIDIQLKGEKAFEDLFISMIIRILPVKKGATVVDRVVKFVAGYVKFISEKEKQAAESNGEEEEAPTSRFVTRLIKYLLKGVEAKDKNIRFRVLQLIAEIVSSIGELDNDIYDLLYGPLVDRTHDKESLVRTQAIVALTAMLTSDVKNEDQEELLEVVLESLAHDPASEVRKAALHRIPLSSTTLPAIIKRTRDIDANIRRAVYTPVLDQLENPKQLTIAQRELIALAGLKDREPAVCAAAAKLFASWADTSPDILCFVELFDYELSVAAGEDNPAQQTLMSLFKTRGDIFDGMEFGDAYWQDLTPAKAFLARVFVDYCVKTEDDARIEANMPVMTSLAFRIQALYNEVVSNAENEEENKVFGVGTASEENGKNVTAAEKQFIIGELMKLSLNLDYADEIGRRKMFALVRHLISQDSLPDSLVPLSLDILRKLSSDEHDLIRIVVEVIHDLRDTESDDDDLRGQSADRSMSVDETPMPTRTPGRPRKPPTEMTPQERERADAIDMRCLSLCIGMLERVNSSFERNSTLEGILGELILPAVKRKEILLRERGFICLGLCCLIARGMALNSFPLFLQQIQPSPESLKLRILQIIFDILMVYEGDFIRNASIGGDRVVEFLTRLFESTDSYAVQTLLCKGLAKLMISGMITDERVLQSLVLAYFSPETVDNQEVRQCLSYFLPAYCYSSSPNQRRMQKVFLSTFNDISRMHRELEVDEEMVTPLQAATLLVDWTDPQKAMNVDGRQTDHFIQFDLAIDLTKALLGKGLDKDDKKVLCQLLGKLYLPEKVDDDKIRTLRLLINNIQSRRPPKDTISTNALSRFQKALSSKYEAQLSGFNEEEYRQLEELKELFEFLDDIIPEDGEEEEMPKRGARKRRSESIVSTTTEGADGDDYGGTPEPKPTSKNKGKAKKRRVSDSDEELSGIETPAAPMRSLPARAARKAPLVDAIPDSEADEELETESEPPHSDTETEDATPEHTPKPSIKSRGGSFLKRRAEQLRREESLGNANLPDEPTIEFGSIMDTTIEVGDAEEDDDEVDNLLDDL